MITLIVKKCKCCGEEKHNKEFPKIGLVCKKCKNVYNKNWRKENPEKQAKISKDYRDKHNEHFKSIVALWAKNNRDKVHLSAKNQRLKLTDGSVKALLNKRLKQRILDIPSILIELKRLQITLHRLIKEKSMQQSKSV